MNLKQKQLWLHNRNYTLMSSPIGYWYEGTCGFVVYTYCKTKTAAINGAYRTVKQVIRKKEYPTWRTPKTK
jgi:hypothetical protein